ncbi:hypothetical protein OR62_07810 [Clostridium tetani]|uniref:hypothetical protein n=1 Tax=Clostridium TaxID=1485 RepID=UPI0005746CE9|nr:MULTISPECIES: hypothetical protein [Clostridium]KHO39088.1 hypothetical protein OR62_07810 [Clostridium tetani]
MFRKFIHPNSKNIVTAEIKKNNDGNDIIMCPKCNLEIMGSEYNWVCKKCGITLIGPLLER